MFIESEQPIKDLPITLIPFRAGSSSGVLSAPFLTGVTIREPLPKATLSSLERPLISGKAKAKMFFDPITKEGDEDEAPKSFVQTPIDQHMEEIDVVADEEIKFFDDYVHIRGMTRLSAYVKNQKTLKQIFQV